jgi:hypothetical protein
MTKRYEKDSIGDLVLRLLTQISCFPGFDSSELRIMQSDVWNLPAFSWYATKSPSLFQLLYCIYRRSSWIVDGKHDAVMPIDLPYFPRLVDLQSRLSIYCIAHYQIGETLEEEVAAAVAMCTLSLLRCTFLDSPFVQPAPVLPIFLADSNTLWGNFLLNTREDDVVQALWGGLLDERALHAQAHSLAGSDRDPAVLSSLQFCLQLTSKADQKAEYIVVDKKRSQLFSTALERYMRDICIPSYGEDDDVTDVPSVSNCLLCLKMFATTCFEYSSSVEFTSICLTALWSRVNFEKSTGEELTLLLKLACQLLRFLVRVGKPDDYLRSEQFASAATDMQQFALMVLVRYSRSTGKEALEPEREEGANRSLQAKRNGVPETLNMENLDP